MPRLFGGVSILSATLLVAFIGVVVLVGLLWRFQEKLLFLNAFPVGYKTPNLNPRGYRSPAERGIPFKDVSFTTRDGVKLSAWLLLGEKPLEAPTFIQFHGNAGNIGFHQGHAEVLCAEMGANVLLLDYRGYGNSEGTPSESGVYADADAALDFLLSTSLVNNKDIFLFGHSLGGAVAIDLARRRGKELKGLVVENTFTSLRDVIHDIVPASRKFDWLLNAIQRMKLSSEDKVRQMGIPALFISGRSDELIPPRHMDKLHHACGSPVKWKVDIPGGDHNSTWLYGGTAYTENLQKFIKTAVSLSTGDLNGDAVASSIKEKLPVSSGAPEDYQAAKADLSGSSETLSSYETSEVVQEMKPKDPWSLFGLKPQTMALALLLIVLLVRKGIHSTAGARHIEGRTHAHPSSRLDEPGLELDVPDVDEARRKSTLLNDDSAQSTPGTPVPALVELVEPDVKHSEAARIDTSTS
ncbi:Abhydrolase domain-containing protein, related [Eimeria acervulina]|uniref:Abhydrolase domain-containing protein, related n=1 Tax=Eimeria acervulina TaxID=5801 RepID=U6GCT5_EIMAC|nr:Abhydrolase domain-containing protein, related [Eimeria acervulina]CDI76404.1 Abhydrolase domain-containing protein, related [Eimeria acervulina]